MCLTAGLPGGPAAVAGVARSSLYHYFANKDEILSFLLRSMLDELSAATGDAASGPGIPYGRCPMTTSPPPHCSAP